MTSHHHDTRALAALPRGWARMLQLVNAALGHATAALFEADPVTVAPRSTFDVVLLALQDELDAHATTVQAWQDRRVSAADLCRIVVGAQLSTDAQCLGELARSLADLARSRAAAPPWPAELDGILREMAQDCLTVIATVAAGIDSADTTTPPPVGQLQRTRNAVAVSQPLLHRRLALLGDTVDVRSGVDLCLAGQCLLRCVERTVSVARLLALLRYATTGGHAP